MIRKMLLGAAALLAAACAPASARELVELSVVDHDSGHMLDPYPHRGDRWIAGEPGHRYGVRLTNTTGERVLVVLSVDGVNAVSGQSADPSQAGYVLGPYESAEISGWRKSLDEVARFYFTDLGDSYAARTGRPRDVGVIGIAVFEEARPRYRPLPAPAPPVAREGTPGRAESKAAAPAAQAEAATADGATRQRIGTGHGEREWSPIGQTRFVRATRGPVQVSELRYDEARRLVALGILPRPHPRWRDRRDDAPRAFPNAFVPDPPRRY
ncbi:hypothetical protein GCM10027084_02090 [Pseudoxanthomonas sangjuensis]|uniref:hypothetical protein n=1 Tax=Pseudoxanthomonas sangjuensis TaxID=1503750 RepID=UPI001FE9FEDC|nr:hypothetical protein [Pseudoxanthomonas sangjuensis]